MAYYRQIMDKNELALAVIVSLTMAAVAFFVDTPLKFTESAGLCLPSPGMWNLSPFTGWFLNIILFACICLLLSFINKEYKMVSGTDMLYLGAFLIMATSNTWISGSFSSTGIFALANLFCLMTIFGCFDKRNSTKDLFVTGTILSFGSMIQYAFVFIIPVYLIGAVIMKSFNLKVLIAYIMGLIAPYWIVLGFGIVSPESMNVPNLTHIINGGNAKNDILFGMLNIWVTVAIGVLLTLANSARIYSGNSKKRACSAVINLLGIFLVLCIIFDFENTITYLATIYMICAIKIGIFFEGGNIRYSGWILCSLGALYLTGFVLMTIF